ncbi:LysR family transcriptional regulator [Diaphorobacter aerolatus]|uniref:LysR family transcriptional regulator n=1 Tax=Diaphorobacter aerolatus TaxID=1288495 RepID=A0A7H0GMT9_9BURK|nr:LysR family transcriptional regulator [Diaphorobacter aerolatus]QNP49605.1 LysR family transcriptional regulator [Diaphorobacter aerolatus]
MWTYKQLEAVYWIARLGGFSQAAAKLHTTQSAISRRVQELELQLETELFDRTARSSRLTEKGEELATLAANLLAQRDAAIEQFRRPDAIARRLRLGVTELTAMTWLPRLVALVQQYYPRVTIEPEVDSSVSLRDRLMNDDIDLIIVPDVFREGRAVCTRLGSVQNVWMCKPGLVNTRGSMTLQELAAYRLLSQGVLSGTGLMYSRWLKDHGVEVEHNLQSSSLIALIGLMVSGIGVSYLPADCFASMVDSGQLQMLDVNPPLPETTYVAMHLADQRSNLLAGIVMLAQSCCNFSRLFQDAGPSPADEAANANPSPL